MSLVTQSTLSSRPSFDRRAYREPNSVCHLVFKQLLSDEVKLLNKQSVVLDIGCGAGIGRESDTQDKIAALVGNMWGIEPDKTIQVPSCFGQVWRSNLEDSDIPSNSVDLAYAFMVLEHVEQPEHFLKRLAACLKPGGVFLGATINANCFFARVARISASLGIQEQVLTLARGKQAVSDYHYPAVYRMNTSKIIDRIALRAGMQKAQILCIDSNEWFAYFPERIRWVAHTARTVFQASQRTYPYMFVRLAKPD